VGNLLSLSIPPCFQTQCQQFSPREHYTRRAASLRRKTNPTRHFQKRAHLSEYFPRKNKNRSRQRIQEIEIQAVSQFKLLPFIGGLFYTSQIAFSACVLRLIAKPFAA